MSTFTQLLATCQSPLKHQGAGKDKVDGMVSFSNMTQHEEPLGKESQIGVVYIALVHGHVYGDCLNYVDRCRKKA